jgi:DNA polymerase III epsilon subunit-like protein
MTSNNSNIIVLDIETTGCINQNIIQIAYYVCDNFFNIIKKCNYLINENINKSDYYNKFTVDYILQNGLDVKHVLKTLSVDLSTCKYIVGHNIINFDIKHIVKYMNKYNISFLMPCPIDTMLISKNIVKAINSKGNIKFPKLSELYDYFYTNGVNNELQHDAFYDVTITYKCLLKLILDYNIIRLDNYIINNIKLLKGLIDVDNIHNSLVIVN